MPLYLQALRGFTPLESGLTTFPQAIGVIVSSQLVGRLYHRVGPRRLIVLGMMAMSILTLPLAFVGLGTSLWWIRAIMFTRGIAMAFAFVPMQAATYANIAPVDTGRASAIYSTQRQVAAALGVATLGHGAHQPGELGERRCDRPCCARPRRAQRVPTRVPRRNRARRVGIVVGSAHP